ncbi:MAG TPA: LOG family protein [Gemmatimonadota bacterium]|nr:LOG family protein [Gemmatimonadota bacterium]
MAAVDAASGTAGVRPSRVSVFGSGAGGEADLDRARRLGAGLARAGYAVLNGGYGGTMEAAAMGAREAGGRAIGVTCAEFTFRSGPNPHLAEVIEAPTLFARLERLVRDGDAYVALPGGNGTLAEIAVAWECLRKGLVEPRPLVAWNDPWRKVFTELAEGAYVDVGIDLFTWVEDVDEAVEAIRERVPATGRG